jgi:hypothetical protein
MVNAVFSITPDFSPLLRFEMTGLVRLSESKDKSNSGSLRDQNQKTNNGNLQR